MEQTLTSRYTAQMFASASTLEQWTLRWLSEQSAPMWGGHLERGEPATDTQLRQWIEDGVVEAVSEPRQGYVITKKGRAKLAR
jgi:hypothetical protein